MEKPKKKKLGADVPTCGRSRGQPGRGDGGRQEDREPEREADQRHSSGRRAETRLRPHPPRAWLSTRRESLDAWKTVPGRRRAELQAEQREKSGRPGGATPPGPTDTGEPQRTARPGPARPGGRRLLMLLDVQTTNEPVPPLLPVIDSAWPRPLTGTGGRGGETKLIVVTTSLLSGGVALLSPSASPSFSVLNKLHRPSAL